MQERAGASAAVVVTDVEAEVARAAVAADQASTGAGVGVAVAAGAVTRAGTVVPTEVVTRARAAATGGAGPTTSTAQPRHAASRLRKTAAALPRMDTMERPVDVTSRRNAVRLPACYARVLNPRIRPF